MTFSMPFNNATRMRALTIGVLALGLLSVQVGRGTLAYFTTSVASTANTFTAGNLHFNIADNNATGDASVTSVNSSIALSNMKPGDSVYAPITISNIGSLDGQYGIVYTSSGTSAPTDLTTALQIGVVGRGIGTGASAANCTGANFATGAMWAEQIQPILVGMIDAGAIIVDSTSNTTSLPLVHGGSDLLCVQVTFPDGLAPSSLILDDNAWNAATAQTFNATVLFTFNGQQKNHPVEFDQPAGGTTGNF